MAGVTRLGAMAAGLSAAADGAGNGAGLEIAEFGNLSQQRGPVTDESGECAHHEASLPYSITYFKKHTTKKENPANRHFHVAHPFGRRRL